MRNYPTALPARFSDRILLGLIVFFLMAIFSCEPAFTAEPATPAALADADRAEAYRLLYQMRDHQANATELRARAQQALVQAEQLDRRAREAFDAFEALRLERSGNRPECTLTDSLEWQCDTAKPAPSN